MGISQAGKLILQALKTSWEHFTTLIVLNLVWFYCLFHHCLLMPLLKEV